MTPSSIVVAYDTSPAADDALALMAVTDEHLARAMHDLARHEGARLVVVGSTHRGRLSRAIMGASAELIVSHSACPVAVAPRGYQDRAALSQPVVSIAYDGSPASWQALELGLELARAAPALVRGTPEHVLVDESRTTELLLMGTHAHGPLARTLLGSVATHVLRRSTAPLVLCPPPHK